VSVSGLRPETGPLAISSAPNWRPLRRCLKEAPRPVVDRYFLMDPLSMLREFTGTLKREANGQNGIVIVCVEVSSRDLVSSADGEPDPSPKAEAS